MRALDLRLRNAKPFRSFLSVAVAYLAATAVGALVVGAIGQGFPAWSRLLAADVAATAVVFVFSVAFNNSSVYDPYWSVAPMAIGLWLVARAEPGVPIARRLVVVALVLAWGARLTWNWARGWRGLRHEDWRYADLRQKTGRAYWAVSFFGLHLMPTLWVYLGALSLIPALSTGTRRLGALDAVALAVTLGAIALETIADEQLRTFRTGAPRAGAIMERGLWQWSRHPNYLGEISFWWGLYLFALAADPREWRLISGPIAITLLFVFISIPLLDRRSALRRPGYPKHMKRVPGLVPRPWRKS